MDDHKKVKQLFKKFEKLKGTRGKSALVRKICSELTVHTSIEEQIFYPALRKAIDDEPMMDEARLAGLGERMAVRKQELLARAAKPRALR